MSIREKILALVVVLALGGWVIMGWVVDPALQAFDSMNEESERIEQELLLARSTVANASEIRRKWASYEKAGLRRSQESADAEAGRSLLVWAESARLNKVKLSDAKGKKDDDKPFGELSYTLNASGELSQVCDLIYSILESPFPLCIEKCVIDVQNSDGENLQLSLVVTTLFTPEDDLE